MDLGKGGINIPQIVCKMCICVPVYIFPEKGSVAFVRSKGLCDPSFTQLLLETLTP